MRQWRMCEACHGVASDHHHVVSRGAGGPDEDWNLVWLCRECHREYHTLGWWKFAERYPHARMRIVAARQRAGVTTESRVEVG